MNERKQQNHLHWLLHLVAQAQARGFYGKLSIHMENGFIQRVVKEESILPTAGPDAESSNNPLQRGAPIVR